jgi:hypothetical protein
MSVVKWREVRQQAAWNVRVEGFVSNSEGDGEQVVPGVVLTCGLNSSAGEIGLDLCD